MAIKILITLEGSEQVKTALDGMAQSGEAFMQQFQGLSDKAPLAEFSSKLAEAKPAIESTTQITHGFAESLRVVIPALRLAGVEVGNFAGFSRLASVGLGGLAAAVTGAVVIALANLEDAARRTKGTLDDLFGSKNLGGEAFKGLQDAAKELGSTVAELAPGFESLTQAWNRFVESTRTFKFVAPRGEDLLPSLGGTATIIGNVKNLSTAYSNFIKILRAGRLDQDAAAKTADAFFKSISEGGKITEQSLRTLPIGTIELLAQAWGRGTINAEQFIREVRLAPLPLDQLLERMGRFGLQSEEAFKTKAIITYKDKLGEILSTLQNSFQTLSGTTFSDAITAFLEKIRKSIESTRKEIELFMDTWQAFKNLFPELPKIVGGTENVPLPLPRPAEAPAVPKTWFTPPQPAEIKQAIDKIDQEVTPAVSELGKRWADQLFGKTLGDALTSAIASIKQHWEEIKNTALVSPAGAAEFTGGPLLQQQEQAAQTQPIVAPFQQADDQIRTIWIALMDYISTSVTEINFSPITQALVQPFTDALPFIRDALLQVEQMIQEIVRQALAAAGAIQQLNQGGQPRGGGGGGFSFQEVASGGYIRGPGTTTSDSIPAWLSNREYVIQARAVDHYGPNLFAALNSMRLPKDLFSHFAIGGLAKALSNAMPRYASGGLATASAGRSLTIVLDGQKFGLSGSGDVIDRLERVATMAGIASVGRPPGWVR